MMEQQFPGCFGLQGGKLEFASRVAPDNKLDKAVAKVADAVEQDDICIGLTHEKANLGDYYRKAAGFGQQET